jgi:hypothetical protein
MSEQSVVERVKGQRAGKPLVLAGLIGGLRYEEREVLEVISRYIRGLAKTRQSKILGYEWRAVFRARGNRSWRNFNRKQYKFIS